jgi:Cd2+/Zn2+-exporting ATPase/Cu+-exporting ATPase
VEHWLFESGEVMRIGLVAVASAAVWLRLWEPLARVSVIGLTAALVGGYPIFEEAFSALRARRMTMELSMAIAVGAALAIGEFFTALVIVLLVLIPEVLERLTVGRGRRAIGTCSTSCRARRSCAGGPAREVGAAEIAPGDVVVVRPGGRCRWTAWWLPDTFVDQTTITGESLPVEKVAGARLRRDHQPVGDPRRACHPHRPRHRVREDHRGGRGGRAVAGADPENRRSARRLPRLLCHRVRGPDVLDHA